MPRPEDRLVYSTDQPVPASREKKPAPRRTAAGPTMPDDGVLRVMRENRRGGIVTRVTGLPEVELKPVLRELQRRCGGGGTAKDGVLILQGDHRDAVIEYFAAAGRRCKKAGG